MGDDEVRRKLQSIGMAKFVEYFSTFKSYAEGKISRVDCIEKLVSEGASSDESGAAIRFGNAKVLFDSKKECVALSFVCEANRVSSKTIATARQLLKQYCR